MHNRSRKPTSTFFCIVFGVACALCVYLFLSAERQSIATQREEALARYGGEQVEVCVATRDIPAGTEISLSDIQVKLWIADLLPADAVRNANDIVGKTIGESIISGEVISYRRFVSSATAISVPQGYCAISVPAKDTAAVGGAIDVGMLINVYATGAQGTELLGQDIRVLSTSASNASATGSSSNAWITLCVPEEETEAIVQAAQNASLYFTLPNQTENAAAQAAEQSNNKVKEAQ